METMTGKNLKIGDMLKEQGILIGSRIDNESETYKRWMEESISLLEAIEADTSSKSRERDYAIITLFLN